MRLVEMQMPRSGARITVHCAGCHGVLTVGTGKVYQDRQPRKAGTTAFYCERCEQAIEGAGIQQAILGLFSVAARR